jgi:hypothetical protein
LKATRDSLQLTQEGQRAWVLHDSIDGRPSANSPCDVVVVVRNFGKIPATVNETVVRVDPRKLPLPETLDYGGSTTKPSVYTLGPNQTSFYKLGCVMAPKVMTAITGGGTTFYVYGQIRYADLYSRREAHRVLSVFSSRPWRFRQLLGAQHLRLRATQGRQPGLGRNASSTFKGDHLERARDRDDG